MEEIDLRRRDVSEKIREASEFREALSNRTKVDCYKQCMDDPWDMKGESVCASACGVKLA